MCARVRVCALEANIFTVINQLLAFLPQQTTQLINITTSLTSPSLVLPRISSAFNKLKVKVQSIFWSFDMCLFNASRVLTMNKKDTVCIQDFRFHSNNSIHLFYYLLIDTEKRFFDKLLGVYVIFYIIFIFI